MRFYVLDEQYKAVMGQQTRFLVLEEAIEAASKVTKKLSRPIKIWEYVNNIRALVGSVQPDGTLVKQPKEIRAIVAELCNSGNEDLADELLK